MLALLHRIGSSGFGEKGQNPAFDHGLKLLVSQVPTPTRPFVYVVRREGSRQKWGMQKLADKQDAPIEPPMTRYGEFVMFC